LIFASCVKCIIYPQDPSDSQFVEDNVVNDAGVDGFQMINDFIKWGEASIPHLNYDHAALLTGYGKVFLFPLIFKK
jgi:hypothetical protein